MSSSPNESGPAAIARRVLELHAEVDRNVKSHQYEAAARMRDERESLETELKRCGNATVIRNVEIAKKSFRHPVKEMLEPQGGMVDESLLEKLRLISVPVRWAICNTNEAPVATLRRRLDVDSITSPYFLARFPVLSVASLGKAKIVDEWVTALARETASGDTRTVWVCTDVTWLGTNGILEKWWRLFEHESFEFVACVEDAKMPWARRIFNLAGVYKS